MAGRASEDCFTLTINGSQFLFTAELRIKLLQQLVRELGVELSIYGQGEGLWFIFRALRGM